MKKSVLNIAVANVIISGAMLLAISACTDTTRAHIGAYGDEARVTCYSGGRMIADDFSTGKVQNADSGSDGYEFKSKTLGRLVQFSGECVVDYGATVPTGWQAVLPGRNEQPLMQMPVDTN